MNAEDSTVPVTDHKDNNDHDDRGQYVDKYKQKVHALNPLRKACRVHTGVDGTNNPNFEGQNNGMNAWMDAQLNAEEIDDDM